MTWRACSLRPAQTYASPLSSTAAVQPLLPADTAAARPGSPATSVGVACGSSSCGAIDACPSRPYAHRPNVSTVLKGPGDNASIHVSTAVDPAGPAQKCVIITCGGCLAVAGVVCCLQVQSLHLSGGCEHDGVILAAVARHDAEAAKRIHALRKVHALVR